MPEERSKRRMDPAFWLFVALAGVLGLGVVAVAGLRGGSARGASQAAHAWLDDVKAERYAEAYARIAGADPAGFDRFREAVSRNAYLRGMRSLRIRRTEAGSNAARMTGDLVTENGRVEIAFHLTKDGRSAPPRWVINGVIVAGTPALPQ